MIRSKIKQAGRKAIIQVGRHLRELQQSREVHRTEWDVLTDELIRQSGSRLIDVLGAKLPLEAIYAEKEHTVVEVDGYEILLVHLNGAETYIHRLPDYSLAMSCSKHGECLFSGVFNPYFKELYFGEKDKGARRNNLICGVNDINSLDHSVIGFALPTRKSRNTVAATRMMAGISQKASKTTVPGSELYGLSQVANGTLSAMVLISGVKECLRPGLDLVRFAGGRVSDLGGEQVSEDSDLIIASNGAVHEALRMCISSYFLEV